MKTTLMLAALVILSTVAWGQEATTTVVNHSDGSRTIVKCADNTPNSTTCSVRNTVLPEWTAGNPFSKKDREAGRLMEKRIKVCKSQHIKPLLGSTFNPVLPPTLTPECEAATTDGNLETKKERTERERAECKKDHDAHAWCSLYDGKN